MPTTWGGPKLAEGKKNPLTLVNIVVAKKSAVQPGRRLAPNMPMRTRSPERIPTKLKMTCTSVKVDVDRPRIMSRLFRLPRQAPPGRDILSRPR